MSDTSSDTNRGHRLFERGLLGTALLLLGWCVIVHVETEFVQRSENRRLEALLAEAPRGVPESQRAAIAPRPVDGELLGRIEIARLGLTAVVQEGVEPRTLRRAVGHIPDTALFGGEGNVGLAGHRDTFFRKLRDVRVGDEIVLTSLDGRTRYLVRETRVVEPGETWVLEPTERASVTLVTCYPFQFIGAAPQRFVVRADRLDEPLLMAGSAPAIIPVSVEAAASATTAPGRCPNARPSSRSTPDRVAHPVPGGESHLARREEGRASQGEGASSKARVLEAALLGDYLKLQAATAVVAHDDRPRTNLPPRDEPGHHVWIVTHEVLGNGRIVGPKHEQRPVDRIAERATHDDLSPPMSVGEQAEVFLPVGRALLDVVVDHVIDDCEIGHHSSLS